MSATVICVVAVLLDARFGEPRRWHPVMLFGAWAQRLEQRWNRANGGGLLDGALAVLLLAGPAVLLAALADAWLPVWLLWPLQALVLWLMIAPRSLAEHARAVAQPLAGGDLPAARRAVARLVSRDTAELDHTGVATAATESVLENGADAVLASVFWFLLAGLPGVVAHRAVNTLDAMWGYRTPRFERFGKAAARLDDLLNWVPARLTALGYALSGRCWPALRCWRRQARHWPSPNAGPVMAAGAGALGVTLGSAASYQGRRRARPTLGEGAPADAASILAALALVRRTLLLWLVATTIGAWLILTTTAVTV